MLESSFSELGGKHCSECFLGSWSLASGLRYRSLSVDRDRCQANCVHDHHQSILYIE